MVANIDKLLIVIANTPKPDLLLVDKLVIYAQILGIEPIIVINKSDLSDAGFVKSIIDQYLHLKVFLISATQNKGIVELENYIKNSVCAVCGQSAVGKSSLINALIPSAQLETQGLSAKIERGKHTTRVNQIFVSNDICIADTAGFSNLELELDYRELSAFYPEFDKYLDDCRYLDCSHVGEGKDCGVISAVEAQKINYDRYSRYVELYKKLKENWEKKYD